MQVEDVRIIMDRNTRRSKGFAYIEMGSRVSAISPHWAVWQLPISLLAH